MENLVFFFLFFFFAVYSALIRSLLCFTFCVLEYELFRSLPLNFCIAPYCTAFPPPSPPPTIHLLCFRSLCAPEGKRKEEQRKKEKRERKKKKKKCIFSLHSPSRLTFPLFFSHTLLFFSLLSLLVILSEVKFANSSSPSGTSPRQLSPLYISTLIAFSSSSIALYPGKTLDTSWSFLACFLPPLLSISTSHK